MPKGLGKLFHHLRRSLIGCCTLLPLLATASTLTEQQQDYLHARQALKQGDTRTYMTLRHQLQGYPLTPYLDFHAKMDDILSMSGADALNAIATFKHTPLFNSARYRYLQHAGKHKRWQDFLAISPDVPRNVTLQCYFYRARLSQPNTQLAYQGAQQLWLHGHSRPKACDPLFKAWEKAGLRTQPLLWSRMLMAFNSGEYALLKYLARKVTAHKQEAKRLLAVYQDPRSLRHSKRFNAKASINADIVDAGLRRLARKDLPKAIKLFLHYQKSDRFSDYQGRKLSRYLVRRALISQEPGLKPYVDTLLPHIDSDDLKEMRLRWALREGDMDSVDHYLPLMSESKRNKPRWQYWLANRQQHTQKKPILTKLATQRNFYGFAAAAQLKQPISLSHQATATDDDLQTQLSDDAGLARVEELLALDKQIDARAEWVLLLTRHDQPRRAQYALLAQQKQWHGLAVQASIQGKLWNDIPLRFPFAADKAFIKASKESHTNIDELRAIARRESAFYNYATSSVGARGLMQLMPSTAKETARQHGLTYRGTKTLYDIDINTALGSRYYHSLVERFDGNRVLATAAYNAGPHRVKRWLAASDGKLGVMAFIESIPFRETREYVQAVLSYRVIYQAQQHKRVELFSPQELSYRY